MAPKKDTKKQPQLAGPGAQRLSRQAPPLVARAGGRAGPHVVQRGRSANAAAGAEQGALAARQTARRIAAHRRSLPRWRSQGRA